MARADGTIPRRTAPLLLALALGCLTGAAEAQPATPGEPSLEGVGPTSSAAAGTAGHAGAAGRAASTSIDERRDRNHRATLVAAAFLILAAAAGVAKRARSSRTPLPAPPR